VPSPRLSRLVRHRDNKRVAVAVRDDGSQAKLSTRDRRRAVKTSPVKRDRQGPTNPRKTFHTVYLRRCGFDNFTKKFTMHDWPFSRVMVKVCHPIGSPALIVTTTSSELP